MFKKSNHFFAPVRDFRKDVGAERLAEAFQQQLELPDNLVRRQHEPAARVQVRAFDELLREGETREWRDEHLVSVGAHEERQVLPLLQHCQHLPLGAVVRPRLAVSAEHLAVAAGGDELHGSFRVRGEQGDAELRARCGVLVVVVLHERVDPRVLLLPVLAPQEAVVEEDSGSG